MSEIIVNLDEARRDLAAVFRWTARESMHEGIANHFSFAVSDDGQQFLMNPYGCLLYTSPSPRDLSTSRMPSSA